MDLGGLSLDQAPPYHTVQRFFLTAPAFLLLTGIILAVVPGYPFYTMVNNYLIGITHLVTLGFMTMTMFGAFFQMLPVVAGVKISRPKLTSTIVYVLFVPGILLLSAGYIFSKNVLLPAAAGLLFLSVLIFVSGIIFKLLAVKNSSPTIHAMRLSLFSLLVLMLFGVIMILARIEIIPYIDMNLLPVHIGWAIFGWVMILIMGVSFQVIPMFYVAPEYPVFFRKYNPYLIFCLLLIYTGLVLFFKDGAERLLSIIRVVVFLLAAFYAMATIRVIGKRKRKLPDPSLMFWKTSMISLLLAMTLGIFLEFYDGAYYMQVTVLAGVILIAGFVVSLIIGMMYKIVPFLSWFHLASRGIFDVPTMKDMLPDMRVKIHFVTWLVFLGTIVFAVFTPEKSGKYIGAALSTSALFLWINLITVAGKYIKLSGKKTG